MDTKGSEENNLQSQGACAPSHILLKIYVHSVRFEALDSISKPREKKLEKMARNASIHTYIRTYIYT